MGTDYIMIWQLIGKVIKGLDLNIADDPYDDICPQGKHVLCPPGADRNNDCECVDDKAGKRNHQMKSVLWTSSIESK